MIFQVRDTGCGSYRWIVWGSKVVEKISLEEDVQMSIICM